MKHSKKTFPFKSAPTRFLQTVGGEKVIEVNEDDAKEAEAGNIMMAAGVVREGNPKVSPPQSEAKPSLKKAFQGFSFGAGTRIF